jgi:hypothetical protein
MEQGWDPEVKKYFRKILFSVALGLIWMTACATAGIYYELGYSSGKPAVYTILFYVGMAISLLLLIRWYYNTWKK